MRHGDFCRCGPLVRAPLWRWSDVRGDGGSAAWRALPVEPIAGPIANGAVWTGHADEGASLTLTADLAGGGS